jgi:hypothetical protein
MEIKVKSNNEIVFIGSICQLNQFISNTEDTSELEFIGLNEYLYKLFDELTLSVLEEAYTFKVAKSEVYKLKEQELISFKSADESDKTRENYPLLFASADKAKVSVQEIAIIIENKISFLKTLVHKMEEYKSDLSKMDSVKLYDAKISIFNRLSGDLVAYVNKHFNIAAKPIEINCEEGVNLDELLNQPDTNINEDVITFTQSAEYEQYSDKTTNENMLDDVVVMKDAK